MWLLLKQSPSHILHLDYGQFYYGYVYIYVFLWPQIGEACVEIHNDVNFKHCLNLYTTHSSVFLKHLFKGHEVSERQQHVEDVTWDFLFMLPVVETKNTENHILFLMVPLHHLVAWNISHCRATGASNTQVWAYCCCECKWTSWHHDDISYISSSMKAFMLKSGILSISCCSRCFSRRSTYTTFTVQVTLDATITEFQEKNPYLG